MMTDIRIVRSELISIVRNNRMPLERKKELIKRRLIAINTFLELTPNNINNKINNKINNILLFLPSIKYNIEIKKIFKSKLINYLTTIKNFPNIILSQLKKTEELEDNNSEIKKSTSVDDSVRASTSVDDSVGESTNVNEKTSKNNSTTNKISMIYNSITNDKSEESTESDSETEQETDEELDSDDEELDSDDEELDEEEEDLLDRIVNNLMKDLPDEGKIKLIMKMTKCKLDHVYKMEAEKNRNIERMEELAIKKLKIKNKYKLKKSENRK
jgi:hypothetical protein